MPEQIITMGRRLFVLEAIKRLSKGDRWVQQQDMVKDLQSQGYQVEKHHVLRDLKALRKLYPDLLECNDNSRDGILRRGLAYGFRWKGKALPETGLTIAEALSLSMVQRHLRQTLPASLTRALDGLFSRATETLKLHKSSPEARWLDKVAVVSPSQPLQPPHIADEVVNTVYQCLLEGECFQATYHHGGNYTFHPLGIIQRGVAIYLVALCNDYDEPRLFALHRLHDPKRSYLLARRPETFNLADYANEQGHFGSGRMITLKARVCSHLGMILEETPLEAAQLLGEADEEGWRELKARVRDSWQLFWWIQSEGDRMIVTAPKVLCKAVVSNLESTLENYQPQ